MSIWGPSDIGSRWAASRTTTTQSSQRLGAVAAPLNLATLSVGDSSQAAAEAARDRLQAASGSLRTAFAAFTTESKPVFTTNIWTRPTVPAALAGAAARVAPLAGNYSVVQTTVKVNTQTSTVRSSSAPIGLDLTTAHSRLSSAALGLDITSSEAASTLRSTTTLGLNAVDASSTLSSTAEMNAAATSLGSSSLAFSGSTSRVEISGAYSGNATSLTFKSTRSASVSSGGFLGDVVSFQVLDQNNTVVESFTGYIRAGEVIDLSDIGLIVRFTEGSLARNATATTTVSQTGTEVNTSASFNAAWGSAPVFENFRKVTAGSFSLNGVAIAVNANDSIDSVLARINGSAAGVTASVVGDRVVLASSSPSESDIVVGSDSSGFLQATKLTTATTLRGNLRDDRQTLSQTSQFGGVTSGSFLVNGVSIAVNKDTDTLESVLTRINSSAAGVTASYNAAEDKVILATTGNSEDAIVVSGDTTGLVAAARLSGATTVVGNVRDDLQVLKKTSQFASVVDGTFQINGVAIAIDADQDSLSAVVQKINDANAGVTARFNAVTNKVELESVNDSESQIVVGGDSTGFLAVAGLSTGNTVVGSIADDRQALSDTAAFASVAAGSFTVNGASVAIDPDADTLQDVLARINNAGAGVSATYDSGSDRLIFTPATAGATLSLGSDSSGFLAAAHVAAGVTGTRVDADAAFDGSTGNGPLFDPGISVQAGSFTINGVTVAVDAADSVNSVLARINASAAGVTATLDSATQLVRLTSTQFSATPITLGADTSGFLAAMKLDGTAQNTAGNLPMGAFDVALRDFEEYDTVSAGTLSINGQQISIDPATTTLRDLIAAIGGIGGVDATLDESSGRISILSTQSGGSLELADTSGVLNALGIATGTFTGVAGRTIVTETQTGTTTVSNSAAVAADVADAADEFTSALAELVTARAGDDRFVASLVQAATDAVASLRDGGVSGLTIGGEATDVRLIVDREALASALDKLSDPTALANVVQSALDQFADRVADVVRTPAAAAPEPQTTAVSLARPQLTPNQAAAALLFQKALERVINGAEPGEHSGDAAADGALDLETRLRIRSQLEASDETDGYAIADLLATLTTNSR